MSKQIHLRAVSANKVIGNTASIKGEKSHQDVTHAFSLAIFDMAQYGGGSFIIRVGENNLTVRVDGSIEDAS